MARLTHRHRDARLVEVKVACGKKGRARAAAARRALSTSFALPARPHLASRRCAGMGAQLSLGIEVINAACAGAALLTLVLVVRRPKAAARAGAPGARRVALEPCEGCVVSGVGLGLPGTGRKVFCGANAAALLRGECLIEPLGDDQADALLARRVVQLQKSKEKGPTKVPITRREQTVGVSARLGDFDLSAEYGVPKALAQTMGKATQIAVAAGLEALKDAGLVADVAGDDRWKLPEALRDGTGVVYARATKERFNVAST